MPGHDLEKLLGGYATDTLTEKERQALFEAALDDQTLFNALADEQALKEVLDDPQSRKRLLASLKTTQTTTSARWPSVVLAWFRRPTNLAWAASVAVALLALSFVVRLVDEVGPLPSLRTEVQDEVALSKPAQSEQSSTVPTKPKPTKPTGEKKSSKSEFEVRSVAPPSSKSLQITREKPNLKPQIGRQEGEPELSISREMTGSPKDSPPMTDTQRAQMKEQKADRRVPLPALGARELFYRQTEEADSVQLAQERRGRGITEHEEELRSFMEAPTSPQALRKDEPQKEKSRSQPGKGVTSLFRQEAQDVTEPTNTHREFKRESTAGLPPLGLRYSILKQQPDSTFSEVDPSTIFSPADILRVTAEVNQPGYLYVLESTKQGIWKMLYPPTLKSGAGDSMAAQVQSRSRYTIPLTGALKIGEGTSPVHVALVFSLTPETTLKEVLSSQKFDKDILDQVKNQEGLLADDFLSKTETQNLLIEKVTPTSEKDPKEFAVYVVDQETKASSRLHLNFDLQQK